MRAWCISDGQLWLLDGDGPAIQVESAFAQEVVQRGERALRKDAWKSAPRDNKGLIPASMLWGGRGGDTGSTAAPRFKHLVRAADGSVYYVLELSSSTGLFQYFPEQKREVRIFHSAQFSCLGLALDEAAGQLILAADNRDGTAYLAVYDTKGNSKGAITGGDTVDAAPSFSARDAGVVLFQSAGVARHPQSGYVMATAPAVINRLEYRTGKLETILQDPAYDFLAPREDAQGNLFYIRRPAERSGVEQAGSALKDTLLLPWRLLKAVFGYLNFFSQIYGREPLRSSGGPKGHELERDVASLWLHGRAIDLTKVSREERGGGLVPASWQLRRRSPNGQDAMVAEHVVSFDLVPDGGVLYTNGFEVSQIFRGDPKSRRHDGLLESVAAA